MDTCFFQNDIYNMPYIISIYRYVQKKKTNLFAPNNDPQAKYMLKQQ